MSIFTTVQQYADQIGGSFTQYDSSKSIIVVPLNEGRFQTVLSELKKSKASDKMRIVFSSKASDSTDQLDARELIVQNGTFDYSKFMIEDGQLRVEASCPADVAASEEIRSMIQEVAQIADDYELKLTGKDIH